MKKYYYDDSFKAAFKRRLYEEVHTLFRLRKTPYVSVKMMTCYLAYGGITFLFIFSFFGTYRATFKTMSYYVFGQKKEYKTRSLFNLRSLHKKGEFYKILDQEMK